MDSVSVSSPSKRSTGSLVAVFLITALLGTTIAYAVLFLAATNRYCGEWSAMILPGYHFGVPQRLEEKGVLPVCEIGWDGQFYYTQANYLTPDPEAYAHIDNPPYRYQRIGLPLVARGFSLLTGSDYVSPHTYLFASLPFVGIAMGALAVWLFSHGYSPLWCLGWAANVGIPICLLHGQPDPLADACFILAMLALIRGMPLSYTVFASLMCLTREPYFAIAAVVFAASVVGLVPWQGSQEEGGWIVLILRKLGLSKLAERLMVTPQADTHPSVMEGRPSAWNYWAYRPAFWQLALLTIPCLVFVGWQFYLFQVFGKTGSQAAGGVILDYPFIAFFRVLARWPDYLRPFYFLVLIMGFVALWTVRRKLSLPLILLPYFVVLSMMSIIVWHDITGYAKAMGTVLATMVIFLPLVPRRVYYALGVVLVCSTLTYTQCLHRIIGPVDLVKIPDYKMVTRYAETEQPELAQPKCLISVDPDELAAGAAQKDGQFLFEYEGLRYPQQFATVPVQITNQGNEPWLRTRDHQIHLVYRWLAKDGRQLWGPAVEIPYDIPPGETFTRDVTLLLPREPGEFTLRLTMRQLPDMLFEDNEGGFTDIPIKVR